MAQDDDDAFCNITLQCKRVLEVDLVHACLNFLQSSFPQSFHTPHPSNQTKKQHLPVGPLRELWSAPALFSFNTIQYQSSYNTAHHMFSNEPAVK